METVRAFLDGLEKRATNPSNFDHVTKVDPDKFEKASFGQEEAYALSHSDAAEIGGSDGVNKQNTLETMKWVRNHTDLPILHEPGDPEQVSAKTLLLCDALYIPEIVNGDPYFYEEVQKEFADEVFEKADKIEEIYGGLYRFARTVSPEKVEQLPEPRNSREWLIDWLDDKMYSERYYIQNTGCKAAERTGVEEALSVEEVGRDARYSRLQRKPDVVYIERSGEWSDQSVQEVETASNAVGDRLALFYGGGIVSREQARMIYDAGGVPVVGDKFHSDPEGFIETTQIG